MDLVIKFKGQCEFIYQVQGSKVILFSFFFSWSLAVWDQMNIDLVKGIQLIGLRTRY